MSYSIDVKEMKTYSWSRPYDTPEKIISIDTHLKKQLRYSPKFMNPIAEVRIKLTGRRSMDYKIAEAVCKVAHIPGMTVWHHVWERVNGLYTMQLVPIAIHQRTCPHAGGCKMWSIDHGNKKYALGSRITRRYALAKKTMQDYVLDYVFEKREPKLNKATAAFKYRRKKQKTLEPLGLDPYGNIFLEGKNGMIYFYNHEEGKLEVVTSIIDNTGSINNGNGLLY